MIRSVLKTGGLFSQTTHKCLDMSSKDCGLLSKTNDSDVTVTMNSIIPCFSETETVPSIDDLLNDTNYDLNDMLQCEDFTDFSDLLLDTNEQPFKLDDFEENQQPSLTETKTSKRKLPDTGLPIVDHNYHVPSKKKTKSVECDDQLEEDVTSSSRSSSRYLERRRKNNAASKRSREIKKTRMAEMEQQVVTVELNNERLRDHIGELDRLTKLMKSMLVQKVSLGVQ